ncbi:hypothetical protein SFBM_1162 [Candidatus Arthromitus sp. SFB-mouse-Japan]|uniref:hypothetical protein n=1 Tax=Candidatus Arthromitus sp. SFB-mouse TaxID=49118 RepID=UPI00021B7DE0|nr:hypothetical protein [Candidatus Arthromitus sp. SFB-mouse]BAK56925.1 hypothetical protein SFBM_1162 [Candidatus Arthromitus sp. SFB-mouse-Japan]
MIRDIQSDLDFIATVQYEIRCNNIVLNYEDCLKYISKTLKVFMYGSNKGDNVYFQTILSLTINKISDYEC